MSFLKASASVIAAGIIAILGSLFMMFCLLIGLMGLYLTPGGKDVPGFPAVSEIAISAATLVFALLVAIAAFGVCTGLGLLRLKKWARISALVWAGLTVFFGSIAVLTILVVPFPAVPTAPTVNMGMVKVLLAVVYVVPILVGVWWLILFNQKSTKEQFEGVPAPYGFSNPAPQPRCPLPVAIIAVFMLLSVAAMFAMPLLNLPVTMILFGHRLRGELGNFLFASTTVLYLAAAIGLLRLKRWSYPLAVCLHAFWMISSEVTFLSRSYVQNMQEILSEMHLPEASVGAVQLVNNRPFALFTLIPGLIVLGILLYYRSRFYKAATAANSPA